MQRSNVNQETQNSSQNLTERLAVLQENLEDLLEITKIRLIRVKQIQIPSQGYDLKSELKEIKNSLKKIQELANQAASTLATPGQEEEAAATIKKVTKQLAEAKMKLETNLLILKATIKIQNGDTDSNEKRYQSSSTLFTPAPKHTSFILKTDSFKDNLHNALNLLSHAVGFIVSMITTVCSAEYDKNSYHHRRHTR